MTLTLIDAVREAGQAVADKHAAYEQAKLDFAAAQSAVKLAEHRAEHAAHTDDAASLVQAVEDADLILRRSMVAAKVAAAMLAAAKQFYAETLHASLTANHDTAKAARRAACDRADRARAELAAAESDFHAANGMLQECFSNGRQRQFDGSLLGMNVVRDAGVIAHVPSASDHDDLFAGV